MTRCQFYAWRAGHYICQLSTQVSSDEARRLLHGEASRRAEEAVNAAVLAGDVATTVRSCRRWWAAWKEALVAEKITGLIATYKG